MEQTSLHLVAAGAQTITGATDFYDLVVNSGASLTINSPSVVKPQSDTQSW